MRARYMLLVAAALAGCASSPAPVAPAVPFVLVNPSFEERPKPGECPRGWGCAAHNDATSFRYFVADGAPGAGSTSLCVEPVKSEPWAFVIQGHIDRRLGGRHLRFSLAAKTTDVAGIGAGAVVEAHDGHGNLVGTAKNVITGTHDWQRLAVDFDVPAQAMEVDVGGLLEGRGRLCIDDARIEELR